MEILLGLFVILAISMAANGYQARRSHELRAEISNLKSELADLNSAVGVKEQWRGQTL